MLTLDQTINVLLIIDKTHAEPQKALDCRPGLDGPNHPTPSA